MWEDLAIADDRPIEYSEDRRRGERPELRKIIEAVRGRLTRKTACATCRRGIVHRDDAVLIDVYNRPRVVCRGCYGTWERMSPVERRQTRGTR